MPKQQTGLRIDRLLFKQFQQICAMEKLRPGEAVESLIRVAVEARSVTGVNLDHARQENTVRMLDEALFRSRLSKAQDMPRVRGETLERDRRTTQLQEFSPLGR